MPVNIFNKIIEENFPNLKKEMPMKSNRNQGYLASPEPNYPTIASPGYTITPEKQDMDLKSLLMMMMEDFKKEIQENTGKQLEALKEETKNTLKS